MALITVSMSLADYAVNAGTFRAQQAIIGLASFDRTGYRAPESKWAEAGFDVPIGLNASGSSGEVEVTLPSGYTKVITVFDGMSAGCLATELDAVLGGSHYLVTGTKAISGSARLTGFKTITAVNRLPGGGPGGAGKGDGFGKPGSFGAGFGPAPPGKGTGSSFGGGPRAEDRARRLPQDRALTIAELQVEFPKRVFDGDMVTGFTVAGHPLTDGLSPAESGYLDLVPYLNCKERACPGEGRAWGPGERIASGGLKRCPQVLDVLARRGRTGNAGDAEVEAQASGIHLSGYRRTQRAAAARADGCGMAVSDGVHG
jgi:hypothetical protein